MSQDYHPESYYNIKKARRKHALKRGRERYGMQISKKDLRGFVHKITGGVNNMALHVGRISSNKSIWGIKHKKEWLLVVYGAKNKEIISILPKEDPRYERIPKARSKIIKGEIYSKRGLREYLLRLGPFEKNSPEEKRTVGRIKELETEIKELRKELQSISLKNNWKEELERRE